MLQRPDGLVLQQPQMLVLQRPEGLVSQQPLALAPPRALDLDAIALASLGGSPLTMTVIGLTPGKLALVVTNVQSPCGIAGERGRFGVPLVPVAAHSVPQYGVPIAALRSSIRG